MKVRTRLPEGYPEELRAYRRKVAGRLELLQVYGDGEVAKADGSPGTECNDPFWMVRLRGFSEERDRASLNLVSKPWGNGHWRFVYREQAEAKFAQLLALPQYAKEAAESAVAAEKKKQWAMARVREGKLVPFRKSTDSTATPDVSA